MSHFLDGPAAGQSLSIRRAPLYLRVVIGPRGKLDALDMLDDEPEPREAIHVYARVGGFAHCCVRHGKGRGCYQLADYRHVADADGERFRDAAAWREWAESDPLNLTPREVGSAVP